MKLSAITASATYCDAAHYRPTRGLAAEKNANELPGMRSGDSR